MPNASMPFILLTYDLKYFCYCCTNLFLLPTSKKHRYFSLYDSVALAQYSKFLNAQSVKPKNPDRPLRSNPMPRPTLLTFLWCSLLQEGGKYGELFAAALRNYGILCIGLYRFRDTSSSTQSPSSKRYVITNPPDDFPLLPTDQVSDAYTWHPAVEPWALGLHRLTKADFSWHIFSMYLY